MRIQQMYVFISNKYNIKNKYKTDRQTTLKGETIKRDMGECTRQISRNTCT